MKNLAIMLLALVALPTSAGAVGTLGADTLIYDAGQVLPGAVVVHSFLLTNHGDLALTIADVSTSCGCTTASLPKNTLSPGESVSLEARFDSSQFAGQTVTKLIHVRYSSLVDPIARQLDLALSATVLQKEAHDLAMGELDLLFFLLVDLRTPEAFASRHLQGALNIPMAELEAWIGSLPRGVFTILYDQDGTLAPSALERLRDAGYPDAQILRGGLEAWTKAYGNRFASAGAAAQERFLLPATAPLAAASAPANPVDPSYLSRELLVLVDLRSPEAYANAHFAGAVNVQPEALSAWTARLPSDAHVILYDEDGTLSRGQALALRGANLRRAQALFGGLSEWRATHGDRFLMSLAK